MTSFVAFSPPPNNAFSFQPTLDGQICNAVIWWNVWGQRWYVSVSSPDGTQIFNLPLIGSEVAKALQSLTWANGIAQANTGEPHGYKFLDTVTLTISGCTPSGYNGSFPCFITGESTFTYKPESILSDATQLGAASYDINIGGEYLIESSLVFREATQMFEISP